MINREWIQRHTDISELANPIISAIIEEAFSNKYPDVLFRVWVNDKDQVCASSDPDQWDRDEPNLDPDNRSYTGPWGVIIAVEAGIVDRQRSLIIRIIDASSGRFWGVFSPVMAAISSWATDYAKMIGARVVMIPKNDISRGYWKKSARNNNIDYRTDRRPF